MAVFDGRDRSRVVLDDVQSLVCTLGAAENVQGYTVYDIKVQRGPLPDNSWSIKRRYSDFDALNNLLLCSSIDLPLPPKKMFGKLEREFVAERQQGLQSYLNFLLSHPFLSSSIHLKKFLDPANYSFSFVETSLQHVSMVFRSEPEWEVVEPLIDFGWRIRKQYFSIKSKNEPKQKFILSWMDNGPDKYLNEKDTTSAAKLLGNIQHPYIYPITMCTVNSNGGLVIYEFLENGSLRDTLCKAKPRATFLKKYGNPKSYSVLDLTKIQTYGSHVLLALKFLHDRGFYHGNLHTGNVALVGGKCKLLDTLNGVLGVSSYIRPYYLPVKKIQTMEDVDVYCFGHLLYEMAFGIPLFATNCDNIPKSCAPELRSIIEAILSKATLRSGLPSISNLLQHPFFAASTNDVEKIHFKVPSQLKESLKQARQLSEQRFKEEQKAVRHSKRISKVHAQLNSEEERKKRSGERKKKNNLELANSTSSERSQASTPTAENKTIFNPPNNTAIPSPPPLPSSRESVSSGPVVANQPVLQPLVPPPPPPPLPPPTVSSPTDRTALLSSIQGFNKGVLKKSETKDCSKPKI